MVKSLPAMQETRVQSLSREDLPEKEMVTHSSILAWKIPRTEKPGRLQAMGSQRVGHDWVTSLSGQGQWLPQHRRGGDVKDSFGYMDLENKREVQTWTMELCCQLPWKSMVAYSQVRISHLQCLLNLEPRRKTAKIQQKAIKSQQNNLKTCWGQTLQMTVHLHHYSHYSLSYSDMDNLTHIGLPWWRRLKESDCNVEDLGSISGWGKCPGEENGYPLQHTCLDNSVNRGA